MKYHAGQIERSQRQLRVGEELKHAIVETLQRGRFHDAALIDASRDVTVTEVRISPDLKHATAFVVALGGADMLDLLPALNESASYFQKEIGRKVRLKFTPKIRFAVDDSFDNADRIGSILRDIDDSTPDDQND
jgi:ribosome-binding factor A